MKKPLEIQKFLRGEGKMGQLKKDPYNLKINTDDKGRRILFKYNQIKSDLSLDITREARGLILDRKNNWEVISFPFPKFFNYEEEFAADIDWSSAKVFEKMDGTCLDGETKIITKKDGKKTIKEICENQYDGEVLSYDFRRNSLYWDNIVGWFIQDNDKEWYELETEDGQKVRLTGDHHVYLPDFNCYRRVDELKGNENILMCER